MSQRVLITKYYYFEQIEILNHAKTPTQLLIFTTIHDNPDSVRISCLTLQKSKPFTSTNLPYCSSPYLNGRHRVSALEIKCERELFILTNFFNYYLFYLLL